MQQHFGLRSPRGIHCGSIPLVVVNTIREITTYIDLMRIFIVLFCFPFSMFFTNDLRVIIWLFEGYDTLLSREYFNLCSFVLVSEAYLKTNLVHAFKTYLYLS